MAAERPQQVFHHLLHHRLPGLLLELLGTVQIHITDEPRAHVTEEGNMQRARSLLVGELVILHSQVVARCVQGLVASAEVATESRKDSQLVSVLQPGQRQKA